MTSLAQPVEVPQLEQGVAGRTPRQIFWARFRKDHAALFGLTVIILLALCAIFASVVASLVGHGPNELFQREMTDEFGLPKGPTSSFIFGADNAGRDLFVRVFYGARTSLLVAVAATGFAMVVGVIFGVVAGFYRGAVDTIISRVIDIMLALPTLLLSIGIAAACGATKDGCLGGLIEPGLSLVIFIIAIFSWPYVARIVRGVTLSLREKEFIEASRSLGAGDVRIMVREVLPNLVAPIIVYSTLLIPNNVLFEAGLSFLGLGVPDRTPSWGRMLADSSGVLDVAWWFWLFPGLFLVATTLAFNLLGDGLRDALDPKSDR